MNKIKKVFTVVLLTVGTIYVIGFLFFLVVDLTGSSNLSQIPEYGKLINGLSFIPMSLFIIWLMKKKYFSTFETFKKTFCRVNKWFKPFIEGISLSLFFLLIIWLTSSIIGISSFNYLGSDLFTYDVIIKHLIFYWIFGNLFAVIGEEIIYRGFLLNYFDELFNKRYTSLFLSSIIFSLAHPQYGNLLQYVIAFTAGLSYGFAYQKFRNLYLSIGIHFSYNLVELSTATILDTIPTRTFLFGFNVLPISNSVGDWMDIFKILALLLILGFLITKKPQTIYIEQGRTISDNI